MGEEKPFTFEISLSVLDSLGRNLYRSFITVIGEAISNSWDADSKNVWIYVDRKRNNFVIKDDGDGMSRTDFQNKFLKIGYSKRKNGVKVSAKGRPYIGRKGIGKLALLSCADKIAVISKKMNTNYVGGTIDNSGLDKAITRDFSPQQYELKKYRADIFEKYTKNHEKGTIVYFKSIKDGIKNNLEFLKKVIALYFRFSLIDDSFNIFVNDEPISLEHLEDLAQKTQFLWNLNNIDDPYVKEKLVNLIEPKKQIVMDRNIKGFIASVIKPRDLKIISADERVGVDLFVNGRLRERDILKHIPTARLAENYFYGQIHFDKLDDDEKDRFATAREGIVADDPKYKRFLDSMKKIVSEILEDWDDWRIRHRQDGDTENPKRSRKERASIGLYSAVSEEYEVPENSKNRKKVDSWVDDLSDDAKYNFESYAECFISENLIRKYIREKRILLTPEAEAEVKKWREEEVRSKGAGNVSIDIRREKTDLNYLSMAHLATLHDKKNPEKDACLARDAKEYKPMRDAIAHTALLTDVAKKKLTTVYENIKGRIRTLLSGGN
ncbi:MAG: ATP-binding protein [Phycisphaerae bacterium]